MHPTFPGKTWRRDVSLRYSSPSLKTDTYGPFYSIRSKEHCKKNSEILKKAVCHQFERRRRIFSFFNSYSQRDCVLKHKKALKANEAFQVS